ncbi:MAG TPA: beta-galactosidase [Aggregatilineales bacterium]|nr:beta-galactosidase [Aggregatilineales bacterium]
MRRFQAGTESLPTLAQLAYRAGQQTRKALHYWPLGLRTLIVLVIVLSLTPAPARLMPTPPQTVDTQHPVVCVHTRLTDEVEDLKIAQTLQLVREMGASSIVEFFPWPYMEMSKGQYDWHHPDRIISMARHEGLQVIARLGTVLGRTPDWMQVDVRNPDKSLDTISPATYADYAKFVGAFVAHFRGQVDKIIVWNEPNLSLEWGYKLATPQSYTELLKLVYRAAHAANPDITVLAGALAPTLEPEGSPNGLNELDYLHQMYAAGAGPYFDALAVHTYGLKEAPDAPPAPDRLNFRRFELQAAIMQQNGDGSKPIYITESGWNDDPRWVRAVSPGQRITYTLDSFRYVEQNWPTVKNLCIWYFRLPLPTFSYMDHYAFATTLFRLKPIYSAVQAYARGLPEN